MRSRWPRNPALFLLISAIRFLDSCKPSEPHLVPYLVCVKGFTEDQVLNSVFPWFVYGMFIFSTLSAPACHYLGYRGVIWAGAGGRMATRLVLIYGTTLAAMQTSQWAFSLATSSDIIFTAYLYTLVPQEWYQTITSLYAASELTGYVLGSEAGQLLIAIGGVSLTATFYISLVTVGVASALSFLLPASQPPQLAAELPSPDARAALRTGCSLSGDFEMASSGTPSSWAARIDVSGSGRARWMPVPAVGRTEELLEGDEEQERPAVKPAGAGAGAGEERRLLTEVGAALRQSEGSGVSPVSAPQALPQLSPIRAASLEGAQRADDYCANLLPDGGLRSSHAGCEDVPARPWPPPPARTATAALLAKTKARACAVLAQVLALYRPLAIRPLIFWWVAAGPLQNYIGGYGTNLFLEVANSGGDGGEDADPCAVDDNGHVTAVTRTCMSLAALLAIAVHRWLPRASFWPLAAGTLAVAGVTATMARSRSLLVVYACYAAALSILQLLQCLLFAQCAALTPDGRYGLLFGVTSTLALALQVCVQLFLQLNGWTARTAFQVIAVYAALTAALTPLMGLLWTTAAAAAGSGGWSSTMPGLGMVAGSSARMLRPRPPVLWRHSMGLLRPEPLPDAEAAAAAREPAVQ